MLSFPPPFWRKGIKKVYETLWQSQHWQTELRVQRTRQRQEKKQYNVKWAKNAGDFKWDPSTYWDHGALETDCKTREKERRCRWHGLHSWLISLILSLQFILNPANGFTESGLRDEFRLTFQYKSNLSYLFSLFSCNFSVCKIINSWKGGGWLQVHKIVPRQCDAVVEMLGLNVEWMEQGTERAKDENYNTLCCPSLMGA